MQLSQLTTALACKSEVADGDLPVQLAEANLYNPQVEDNPVSRFGEIFEDASSYACRNLRAPRQVEQWRIYLRRAQQWVTTVQQDVATVAHVSPERSRHPRLVLVDHMRYPQVEDVRLVLACMSDKFSGYINFIVFIKYIIHYIHAYLPNSIDLLMYCFALSRRHNLPTYPKTVHHPYPIKS